MAETLPVPFDFETPEKPLDMSVDAVTKLTHDYLNTNMSITDIGMHIGVSTAVVKLALKQFGLVELKKTAIAEAQRAEQAAYVDFLLKNRVPTAEKHLEISNKLVDIVGKLAEKVQDPDSPDFQNVCEDLKKSIGTLRTLSEVLEKSSAVGARSVSLSGNQQQQTPMVEALAKAAAANNKRPLISFNLGAGPAQRQKIGPMQVNPELQTIDVDEDSEE